MHGLFAYAAPVALLIPLATAGSAVGSGPVSDIAATHEGPDLESPEVDSGLQLVSSASPIDTFLSDQVFAQVRIEQRVVVRISAQPASARQDLAAQMPRREPAIRYEERRIGKCLPVEGIAAFQAGSGNRLVLFLRDQRMVSLSLDKNCRGRDFYSGLYVERHKDGKICVERDKLQSRTGVKCEVERFRQLVEVRE
jgi:hypothetical protein